MSSTLSSYALDLLYTLQSCLSCFPSSPNLRLNSRSFKILRLLGEGGFSYVYLVQSTSSSAPASAPHTSSDGLYALKKIRCPFGAESVSQAMREVEAYALFTQSPNIIHALDHAVLDDKGGDTGSKTVYILLPYFRRGNLQDVINANLVNHTKFPERRLMVLVLGVCRALRDMHRYKIPSAGALDAAGVRKAKRVTREALRADLEAGEEVEGQLAMEANSGRRRKARVAQNGDIEQEPLMDDEVTRSQEGYEEGEERAYAHRDIKPGNIMIADDGRTPILMDLGSLAPSPTVITSRSQAIAVQDQAAEHSTMPYRAPELFDVKTDCTIDTKVDVWSLGCTIYACLVGRSPFEARSEETGGSLTMCVLGGDWRFPDEAPNSSRGKAKAASGDARGPSEPVRDVVRRCLRVEPSERPDVDELMRLVENVIEQLPEEGSGE